ncbi:DgyrCDS30 [Dimorphilus gyrociliatus]|uniref:Protein ZIP4 homolog n=1 Tax=Dimorphilus gyrociliatus TaxID=2664684 RepID=A0A7I8V3L4_9ANNE|nr:DgyrCDS30 [Dimorphilus gyrociliatus]
MDDKVVRRVLEIIEELKHPNINESDIDEMLEEVLKLPKFEVPKLLESFQVSLTEVYRRTSTLWNYIVQKKVHHSWQLRKVAKMRTICVYLLKWVMPLNSNQWYCILNFLMILMKSTSTWIDLKEYREARNLSIIISNVLDHCSRTDPSFSLLKENYEFVTFIKAHFLYQIYIMIGENQQDEALKKINSSMDRFSFLKTSDITQFISNCFNTGVHLRNDKKLDSAIDWFEVVINIQVENCPAVESIKIKAYQALTQTLMERKDSNDIKSAEDHLKRAVEQYSDFILFKRYIEIKILLGDTDEEINKYFKKLVNSRDANARDCLVVVTMLKKSNRDLLITKLFELLKQKFDDPLSKSKIYMANMEYLLSKSEDQKEFCNLTDKIITDMPELGAQESTALINNLFERAVKEMRGGNEVVAIELFEKCLKIMRKTKSVTNEETAKIYRNIIYCSIAAGRDEETLTWSEKALSLKESFLPTCFMIYKLYLDKHDFTTADTFLDKLCCAAIADADAVKKLSPDSIPFQKESHRTDTPYDYVSTAAKLAFEVNQIEMAIKAFKCICECSPSSDKALMCCKALCRIYCTTADEENVEKVYDDIINIIDLALKLTLEKPGLENMCDYIIWFKNICWNLCGQNTSPKIKKTLLNKYLKFSASLDTNTIDDSLVKCRAVTAELCLQIAEELPGDEKEKASLLQEAKDHIDYINTLKSNVKFEIDEKLVLALVCMELKLIVLVNDRNLTPIVKKIENLVDCPSELLLFASVHLDRTPMQPDVRISLMKRILKKSYLVEAIELDCLSAIFKLTITRLLHLGNLADENSFDLAYISAREFIDFIQTKNISTNATDYLPWFTNKAWNLGVILWSYEYYHSANKWCELAIETAAYCHDYKESFEIQVVYLYSY